MNTLLVTGVGGLVGSECARHFHGLGWQVVGLDGNQRMEYFGPDGDTTPTLKTLRNEGILATSYRANVADRDAVANIVHQERPDLVIHAAAQPSHDYAATHPLRDWETNATGTLNVLEAVRQHSPDAVVCFMSTNKIYGDAVNQWGVTESATRYEFASRLVRRTIPAVNSAGVPFDPPCWEHAWEVPDGVDESIPIDQSTHSLFGVSKAAADLMTQEYGRCFGMRTVCFRAGCLTGGAHAGAEQHGFLAYMARCLRERRTYRIYGYKGKQVRDNLHACDVARACEEFYKAPKAGAVYNLGGGRENSCSVLEAIEMMQQVSGKTLATEYVEEARKGDHLVWITDTTKFRSDYPGWSVMRSLESIIEELCAV